MAGAAKKKETERGIEETLKALEIDTDVDPEVAAQDAAAATTVEVEEEEPLTGAEDTEEDDEDDDEDDEGEEEVASSANVEVVVPKPPPPNKGGRPRKNKDKPLEGVAIPPPDPGPALVPPPPAPRARTREKSPVAGKMGKGISEKVPGAEKVKVYKRIQGQKHFVNDYNKADLAQFPDFESFLVRYVKPEHGAGEYDLVGVDANNREIELGQIRLIESPRDNNRDAGALHLVESMLQQQKDRDEKWLSRMRETMAPRGDQTNPLELLTGVMALQEKLNGKADAASRAAAADGNNAMSAMMKAMGESSSQTMQMMMMMMQQQQQAADRQNQLMMSLLAKPKEEDPVTKLLLMKMVEEKNEGSSGPLPPPPPPPNPMQGLPEILTAMAGFMSAMGGGGGEPGPDEFKEFLQQWALKQQSDGLSTKEMIQLLIQKDDKPGTDDFRRSIDNMAAIMNVAQNINRGQEGGAAAGLWDALAALFSNRDFAGSVANTIRNRTDQGVSSEQTQLHAERQRIEAERQRLAMQARLLQKQQLAAGEQPVPMPPSAQPQAANMQLVTPPPQQVPQQVPQGQAFNPAAQQARAEQIAKSRGIPQLPANAYEYINQLVTAKDDAELVGKTVQMFISFAEYEDWREFMETLLSFFREGNKGGAMQYLGAFFEGMSAINMMDTGLARKIIRLINVHFDAIRSQMDDIRLDGDEEVTAEDLLDGEAADELADELAEIDAESAGDDE